MKLKKKLHDNTVLFVPDVQLENMDNRSLPKTEQISVRLRVASRAQRDGYMNITHGVGVNEGKIFIDNDYRRAIERNVIEVRNLEFEGGPKEIDGSKLFELQEQYPGFGSLMEECYMKICGIHPDDKKKAAP